jgi:hypothetical protein
MIVRVDVKERGILMSGEMVRAILREIDPKTQTRRVVKAFDEHEYHSIEALKGHPDTFVAWDTEYSDEGGFHVRCPYGRPGDRLWVRETWATLHHAGIRTVYAADGTPMQRYYPDEPIADMKWRPSIHMPRWASRITLEITDVRVQRLQDISEEDARAEGVTPLVGLAPEQCIISDDTRRTHGTHPHTLALAVLWDGINGPGAWLANPWVWAITFKRVQP